MLRVPLYPANRSLSFSPGCQLLPLPIIQATRFDSMMLLTQDSRTKSIMRPILPRWLQAKACRDR